MENSGQTTFLNKKELAIIEKYNSECDVNAIANGINTNSNFIRGVIDIDGSHRVLGFVTENGLMILDTTLGMGGKTIGVTQEITPFAEYLGKWNAAAVRPNTGTAMRINPKFSVWSLQKLETTYTFYRTIGALIP